MASPRTEPRRREVLAEQSCTRARERLESFFEPKESESASAQFMPRNELVSYLDHKKVKEILECKCTTCRHDRAILRRQTGRQVHDYHLTRIVPDQGRENDHTAGAISLFALLIYVNHPAFITEFAEKHMNDSTTLDSFRDRLADKQAEASFLDELQRSYWSEYLVENKDGSRILAKSFRANLYKFAVPFFNMDEHSTTYNSDVVLPFREEEKIGEGSGGEVYGFGVHPHYSKGQLRLARKQMFDRGEVITALGFHLEKRNLESVRQLNHPHIIQIVKSYRKGKELNIVFPRAKTNLHDCLRNESSNFGQILTLRPVQASPIWNQMLGIATALKAILTETVGESERPLYGYHFDLKPRNILVDWGEKDTVGKSLLLQITDFGMAWFKRAGEGSSHTKQRGGDEQYGAPETNLDLQNRKYDIWSLGCILLEVVVFVVQDYAGIRKLDAAIAVPDPKSRHGSVQCFYEQSIDSAEAQSLCVKPSVVKLIQELRQYVMDRSKFTPDEEKFVHEVLSIVNNMLEVRIRKRLTSAEVVEQLQKIILPKPETVPNGAPSGNKLFGLQGDEIEVGGGTIGLLGSLLGRWNIDEAREDFPILLQVSENDHDRLRFTTVRTNMNDLGPSGRALRSEIELIPQYAMRKGHDGKRLEDGIRLVHTSNPHQSLMDIDICGHLDDLRRLQGVLLRQGIIHSIDRFDRIECHKPFESAKKIKDSISKGFKITREGSKDMKAQKTAEDGPYTVQLWRHADYESLREKKQHRPINHIVIYCPSEIVLIPVDDSIRMVKLTEAQKNSDREKTLKTEPAVRTPAVGIRTFPMYVLKSRISKKSVGPPAAPGFPLDYERFMRMARENETKFSHFIFVFRQHADMLKFYDMYLNLKAEWLHQKLPENTS